jgi:geranylgeranyl diphosphate synthase type I
MFRYHLGWSDAHFIDRPSDTGKRIRPLLCLISCEAVGGDWRRALPLAAAIELVHNFSLIHDDIEDQSEERRGRPTVWKLWGLAQGLNAGDGLFMIAHLALDRMPHQGLPTDVCQSVNTTFDAMTLALCHGQFLDLQYEARLDVTQEEYMRMVRGKTAALMSASTRLGAMLGTRDEDRIQAFGQFGENIGLSFQIADDILGIWGEPSVTGKSTATDILSKKKSLPVILGLNSPDHKEELQEIYRKPCLDEQDVARVLNALDQVNAQAECWRLAEEFRAKADAALDRARINNRAGDNLRSIAYLMARRTK